jgi:nitroreductase
MDALSDVQERKTATPDHDIDEVFRRRWSPRAFADRPVEVEKLQRMLEAARWTMSSYNEQPWRYVVAEKHRDPDTYQKVLSGLTEGNRTWAKNAPVLMLSFHKETFSHNGRPNRCGPHDVGAASAALTFQATKMDLYVHQMAGIRKDEIRRAFDVPGDFEPMAGLAVGYLGDPEMLGETHRASEQSPRSRKPMADFVFGDTWDEPADLASE